VSSRRIDAWFATGCSPFVRLFRNLRVAQQTIHDIDQRHATPSPPAPPSRSAAVSPLRHRPHPPERSHRKGLSRFSVYSRVYRNTGRSVDSRDCARSRLPHPSSWAKKPRTVGSVSPFSNPARHGASVRRSWRRPIGSRWRIGTLTPASTAFSKAGAAPSSNAVYARLSAPRTSRAVVGAYRVRFRRSDRPVGILAPHSALPETAGGSRKRRDNPRHRASAGEDGEDGQSQ